ncbi:MAG: putative toxin-antitoxin system toxin component, PIN family [Peptococcaceae bacterium]|jgi:putative PIN family toxin of toxin-antitoxin system|nr:putative toxin-antitoxin system toxin component, PIN family [Peptococcaceae bacterium]
MTQIKVFLDSSVIIAALASKKGGSFEILALAETILIIPFISEKVVKEVFRNVQKKLPSHLDSYHSLIKSIPIRLVEPTAVDMQHAGSLINEKDAHILAAAMTAEVDWLLSMDKHFLDPALKDQIPFSIGKPGDFLTAAQLC